MHSSWLVAVLLWLPLVSAAGYSLGESAAGLDPLKENSMWRELVSFRPPTKVQSDIRARGEDWAVHRIEDAEGPCNLDYYSVRVKKLPKQPGTETAMTPTEALTAFREQLRHGPAQRYPRLVSFRPLEEPRDADGWKSGKIGTMMLLDFRPFDPQPFKNMEFCSDLPWVGDTAVCKRIEAAVKEANLDVNFDDGCVVVSMSSPKELRVSTVRSGSAKLAGVKMDERFAGAHPVSGNRAFGYSEKNGTYTFYVMGADRATPLPKGLIEKIPVSRDLATQGKELGFHLAEMYWRGFVSSFRDFVNANGGEATVDLCVARRVPWDSLVKAKVYDPTGTNSPKWE